MLFSPFFQTVKTQIYPFLALIFSSFKLALLHTDRHLTSFLGVYSSYAHNQPEEKHHKEKDPTDWADGSPLVLNLYCWVALVMATVV